MFDASFGSPVTLPGVSADNFQQIDHGVCLGGACGRVLPFAGARARAVGAGVGRIGVLGARLGGGVWRSSRVAVGVSLGAVSRLRGMRPVRRVLFGR